MINRTRNTFLVIAASVLWVASLVGCQMEHSFSRHHHVGNVYEVVGNLCILGDVSGDMLHDEEGDTLDGWQKHAERFHKRFERLPIGTKIRIASIKKETQSSWNNGTVSYYRVFVNVLSPGHEGMSYDASSLMGFGHEGCDSVTLKLIADSKKSE